MELGGGTAMLCAGSARGTALERCICGPLVLFPRSILHPPAHSCPAELDLGGLFLLFPVKSIHPPPRRLLPASPASPGFPCAGTTRRSSATRSCANRPAEQKPFPRYLFMVWGVFPVRRSLCERRFHTHRLVQRRRGTARGLINNCSPSPY